MSAQQYRINTQKRGNNNYLSGNSDMAIKRNIGRRDLGIRLCISLILIYFGFINETLIDDQIARLILGIFGSISLLIASIGFCPFYPLIGYSSTCQRKNRHHRQP